MDKNDDFFAQEGPAGVRSIRTRSNRHGGMLGGISSGMPIVVRAAIKPTSSLSREQHTVTSDGQDATIRTKGRHDPCLLPRFVPIGEAMRSEEHTSELQSRVDLVCRLLLE